MNRLDAVFFASDAITVARQLLGKTLVRKWEDGTISRYKITETEAYFGEEDKACHACKGKTQRTQIMYAEGGYLYVYLIYGIYWLLNVVTGNKEHPEAVLIRGINNISGSGRVGKELKLDKSFYGENLISSDGIWIEDAPEALYFFTATRIGIDYADEEWKSKPWRFVMTSSEK